uniref:Ankyrin repeat-containing protein BDA1-like n=1 Tax=Nelumbo nucifera TaxID=4432 RepID=A0A822ZXR2_NELNU|nr:TPA_asm: hypothetical protein HUJ06_017573 [Nelumbo nucifera]
MDRRLFQAAHRGNTATLHQLLEEDPLILERVALAPVAETPLHVAALAGKTEFVSEILRLRPEFSKELNQDGFSPLHMASANGHVEVVKEMLKFGSDLCLVKDRDGRTPLHCAAIKGRVDVMIVLLLACAESAREVTARGETVLHLAVKNHQLEAFRVLVESFSHEWLLKAKDREGNTVFHLASFRRQNQVN